MYGVAGDLKHQQEVFVKGTARLLKVHVEEAHVVRRSRRHHHVVDPGRQVKEEAIEGSGVVGVECGGALRFEFGCSALKGFGIAAGEDHLSALGVRSSGCFEPDAGATADHDDGLPEEFWFAVDGKGCSCCVHNSSKNS